MILRLAATASVLLGLAMITLYVMELGLAPWSPAPERHVRRMKNRVAMPAAYEPIRFEDMAVLPKRAQIARVTAMEGRAVSLEGYVQGFGRAADGDYHLDLAPWVDTTGHLVPYLSAEITPQFQRGSETWTFERLAERFRPRIGSRTGWEEPPRKARVSGWLMYDAPYEGATPSHGMPPHATFWEIHPVTRIEVWNDATGRYEEFAR